MNNHPPADRRKIVNELSRSSREQMYRSQQLHTQNKTADSVKQSADTLQSLVALLEKEHIENEKIEKSNRILSICSIFLSFVVAIATVVQAICAAFPNIT